MDSQTNQEVTWTPLELTGLLEEEDAHVYFERTTKHLALHPYHLNNVQRGINTIFKSTLNSYDRELKGFVLAFRNPRLLRMSEHFYDAPFTHIDMEADFYLFRPTVGSFLKGIVNKKGLDHIVVLVHKIYTISIPKPDDTEEWPGDMVKIGQEIRCCINHIDNKSKPTFICGTLNSDYSQGCRLLESTINIADTSDVIENHDSNTESHRGVKRENSFDNVTEPERKKRKKHSKKSRESDSESVFTEDQETIISNTENAISKSIKYEKEFHKDREDNISNASLSSSKSEASTTKKRKKRKTSCMIMSDSEPEKDTKIKVEKFDPVIDRIINETSKNQISHNENEVTHEVDENIEVQKLMKKEDSIKYNNTSDKKKKKNSKKQAETSRDPQESAVEIKSENKIMNDVNNISDRKRKKSSKKHAEACEDLQSEFIPKIKTEDETAAHSTFERKKKKSSKKSIEPSIESQSESAIKIKSENEVLDDTSERKRKKKRGETSTDSQSESAFRIKDEDVIIIDAKERKKSVKKHAKASKDSDSELGFRIKTEDEMCNNVNNISGKDAKKSPTKKIKPSKDSDTESEIRSTSDNKITNNVNNICRAIKYDSEESTSNKKRKNTSDVSSYNSDLDHTSKKLKSKKTSMIPSDSELKSPAKVKVEKV